MDEYFHQIHTAMTSPSCLSPQVMWKDFEWIDLLSDEQISGNDPVEIAKPEEFEQLLDDVGLVEEQDEVVFDLKLVTPHDSRLMDSLLTPQDDVYKDFARVSAVPIHAMVSNISNVTGNFTAIVRTDSVIRLVSRKCKKGTILDNVKILSRRKLRHESITDILFLIVNFPHMRAATIVSLVRRYKRTCLDGKPEPDKRLFPLLRTEELHNNLNSQEIWHLAEFFVDYCCNLDNESSECEYCCPVHCHCDPVVLE